ncbi:flagellar biosynthetic protein FliO [Novilysobacter arseniciresistens]|uniref:flagellar biosynthetic protein FliO n=1 Tax=Novilysobacter arseniciresistens TaxID=1385522 RepID=UPI0006910A22|nr:flagellar biosynthetic protein FliO [Lysobacter arseniciresistens]
MKPSPITADAAGVAQTWPLLASAGATVVEPLPAAGAGDAAAGVAAVAPAASAQTDATAATLAPASAHARFIETSTNATTTAPRSAASAFTEGQPVATATTAQPTAAPLGAPPSGAGMVGTTVVTLLLVIGFILLLAWLAKRMPGIGGAANPALKVVGSLALGPRERVVVVDVGGTQLLLATGPGGTRTLHTLEQPLPVAAGTPSPFAQVLAQQFGKKPR